MTTLIFPFPPSDLSPNARVHWGKKAKAFKAYKESCMWLCKGKKGLKGASKFKVTFLPPDARRRDTDNMLGAAKGLFDALSAVTGVDDSKFEWTCSRGAPVAHGQVTVEVLG